MASARAMIASLAALTLAPTSALDCATCTTIVGIAQEIAENATTLRQVVGLLDEACHIFAPNATSTCEAVVNITTSLLPWIDKELNTIAWPIPQGFCSVFLPVCENPCCSEPAVPEQVHLALTGNPSEMSVSWVTLDNAADSAVQWGVVGGGGLPFSAPATISTYTNGGWVGTIYVATMTGLLPGTQYAYSVGSNSSAGGVSEVFSFTTLAADAGSEARPLRIVQLGDTGYGNNSDVTIATISAMVATGEVDLVLHVGDVGYADGYMPHWDVWMNKIQPIAAYVPYMVAPGNHEIWFDFAAYRARFHMPQAATAQSMYYSFPAGPLLHVAVVNTESPLDTADLNSTVAAWLTADLAAATANRSAASNPWVIVAGHRPFYCSNRDKTQCGIFAEILRFQAEAILAQAKVDLVITAHEHGYERLWPTYNNAVVQTNYSDPAAPVYVVQGAGGNREGNDLPSGDQPWSAFQSAEIGFAVVTVAGPGALTYDFRAASGASIDAFTITKGAGV